MTTPTTPKDSDQASVDLSMEYLSSNRNRKVKLPGMRTWLLLIIVGAVVIGVSVLSNLITNPYVPAGHEGYVFERPRILGEGGFKGTVKGPGNYGLSVFRNEVISVDIRPRTVTEPFRTFVREAVQNYDSRQIKANRSLISDDVKTKLTTYLDSTPFEVVSLVVGNIDYPEIVARAVENKLAAEQLLEEKSTQKEIARRDAEIRVEEAKGIAQAQRIINETLTPNYLQHEAINAQLEMAHSPNHTTVYIPSGVNGIPLVYSEQARQER